MFNVESEVPPLEDSVNALGETQDLILSELKKIQQEFHKSIHVPSTPLLLKQLAVKDSANYIMEHFPDVQVFIYRHQTLKFALSKVSVTGCFLEFGVATGETINLAAKLKPQEIIFGFDSFEGLPEDWGGTGKVAGDFGRSGSLPSVLDNVELVKGWFSDTLPDWASKNCQPISYLHVDCDLYSSTSEIFTHIGDRLVAGSIIVFDEYFGFPNWRNSEHKAFMEFLERSNKTYRALAISHQALVVMITS